MIWLLGFTTYYWLGVAILHAHLLDDAWAGAAPPPRDRSDVITGIYAGGLVWPFIVLLIWRAKRRRERTS